MSDIKATTKGEWIVTTNDDDEIIVVSINQNRSIQKTIATCGSIDVEGESESIANAALIAVAPDMLDALISIQETLNSSINVIDLEGMNDMISAIFAKLANEAGEEL